MEMNKFYTVAIILGAATLTPALHAADIEVKATFAAVRYFGGYYAGSGTDNFLLEIGDTPYENSNVTGPGRFFLFSAQTERFADGTTPCIVPGTYTLPESDTYQPFTLTSESGLYTYDESMQPDFNAFTEAKVAITAIGTTGDYSVRATLTLDDGRTAQVSYTGEVPFTNVNDYLVPEQIDSDIAFTADYCEAYYDGDGFSIDLMDGGNPYENFNWYNRNRMEIIIMPKTPSLSFVEPGVYTVGLVDQPYTCVAGRYHIAGGTCSWAGSYYFYSDANTQQEVKGFFTSGTVTITRDEATDTYGIEVDVVDMGGHSIKASYSGAIDIGDSTGGASRTVDLAVTAVAPTGTVFTDSEYITITVANTGTGNAYNTPVVATVYRDGNAVATLEGEIWKVMSDQTAEYTFPDPVDLSLGGDYTVEATVKAANDKNDANDLLTATIHGLLPDCGIMMINSPTAGTVGTAQIKAYICNYGIDELSAVPVVAEFTTNVGTTRIEETYDGVLPVNGIIMYTFAQSVEIPSDQAFSLTVATAYAGDVDASNDACTVANGTISSAIADVAADRAASHPVYTVTGLLVAPASDAATLRSLPAGIYIVGGRKLIVR